MICKYSLPFCELSCHFLDSMVCSTVFSFGEIQLIYFFYHLCFAVISNKPLPNPRLQFTLMFYPIRA